MSKAPWWALDIGDSRTACDDRRTLILQALNMPTVCDLQPSEAFCLLDFHLRKPTPVYLPVSGSREGWKLPVDTCRCHASHWPCRADQDASSRVEGGDDGSTPDWGSRGQWRRLKSMSSCRALSPQLPPLYLPHRCCLCARAFVHPHPAGVVTCTATGVCGMASATSHQPHPNLHTPHPVQHTLPPTIHYNAPALPHSSAAPQPH